MASVHDVAAYILRKRGGMTTMKLQKLCYYSQGWSLAWDGQPLFSEDLQAWANGPVVYELFQEHRGKFNVSGWSKGNPGELSKDQRETIDAVLDSYGSLTGQQLSEKTHNERPWVEARGGLSRGAASSAVIALDLMQDYFGALAADEPELTDEEKQELYNEMILERDLDAFHAQVGPADLADEFGYTNCFDEHDWHSAG